jgi:predicted GIY-YIG superfamily endonuclease
MAQQRTYYVYIMASKSRVLYIGVTGFLMQRVLQHRAAKAESSHAVTASIVGCISKAFTTSETLLHGKRN